MTDHPIATHDEWLAAREELLEREKEHTRLGDELAKQRRELPWVRVDEDYRVETADGEALLGSGDRSTALRRALEAAGFVATPRGLRLRA